MSVLLAVDVERLKAQKASAQSFIPDQFSTP